MPFFYIEAYTAPSKFGPFFKDKVEVWDINGICILNVPSFLKSNQANRGAIGFVAEDKGFEVKVLTMEALYI